VSSTPLQVETSDEKLDQLIAAFAGELETEAVMDSAESKTRSLGPVQVEAEADAPGLVDETVQIIQTLSDQKASRTKSAKDWLPLLLALGFLYLGFKIDSPSSNAGLVFMVAGGLCALWWIVKLKVASTNPASQPVPPSVGERVTEAVMDSAESKARSFHEDQVGTKTDARSAADEESDAQARRAKSLINWLLILLAFGFLFLSLVIGGSNASNGLFSMLAASLCGGFWLLRMIAASSNTTDDKSS
jgi:hypothetical protein